MNWKKLDNLNDCLNQGYQLEYIPNSIKFNYNLFDAYELSMKEKCEEALEQIKTLALKYGDENS